jgi:alkylation response protein AidB-like acyl-CoA dehydrogenase
MSCSRKWAMPATRERRVFGKPLLDNQVIHFRLAELKSEVEALRSIVYRACEDYLAGKDVTMLASMGKLKAGRLRREVSDSCLQYWGGAPPPPPAISGTIPWPAATATAASARSAAAPTRSCCRSSPS